MNDEKILSLLKKLDALAKRGVDGERENAAERLKFLMDKYQITAEQIEGEVYTDRKIYVTNEQRTFAAQVIASVVGDRDVFAYKHEARKKKRALVVSVTDFEFIEIQQRIDFYWEKYQDEMKIFYSAFIQKNKLYRKPSDDEPETEKELTPEERARLFRMRQMMNGMEQHTMQKQIEA